ncbi:MAG: 23S rRNA (adenine(2503)-C(2))-methyltransferase RlmN [Firmicutes bacterium]|nr:23S rRNA (adenine(2503)-C(2))-methyltransferase RlmN [Bacillota bacterium]
MPRPELLSMDLPGLTDLLAAWGEPAYRARQLFGWLHQKNAGDLAEMSDLPKALRRRLAEETDFQPLKLLRRQESAAGDTVKLLLELADGEQIETVLMLYRRKDSRDRATCCVSSQSGCAMGCAFCATGQYRRFRNLTAGEILGQCYWACRAAREKGFAGLSNVVFMGMGEPLYNLNHVAAALAALEHPLGLALSHRRVTVSTCGVVPQIYRLSEWEQPVELAVSLHSADEALRRQLMPGAGRWSLAQLMEACRAYRRRTGRRLTFEYALFKGVNDSPSAAAQLAALLTGEDILVNIIPANPVEGSAFTAPSAKTIENFTAACRRLGIHFQLRESRGQDIDGACGQLRKRNQICGDAFAVDPAFGE